MTEKGSVTSVLERLSRDHSWRNVTATRTFPPSPPLLADLPEELHPALKRSLAERGIDRLYRHQSRAWELVRQGAAVVIATPTASGKSLAYHLPVLDRLLRDSAATAIYIFPTKALARDQLDDLVSLWPGRNGEIGVYDGDTPAAARRRLRAQARLIITNPDMLHTALLPHHPSWSRFFAGLQFVVIDEVHQYRGIFGSHTANVLRRLERICSFAGSSPGIISSSATIANPGELISALTGREAVEVLESGAPAGRKDFVFYNPPLIDRERGVRAGNWWETVRITMPFVKAGHKAIVFARSRTETEIILTYFREALGKEGLPPELARGYRGGYLPAERRRIEEELRSGEIRAVVSTTALELGIDIGDLDVCVMSGYPGSVSSTYQQAGRAGRRSSAAAAFLVAENSPLDQFIVTHPDYFFGLPAESAAVNPDNPHVLRSHLACACFELPFGDGERFGGGDAEPLLETLAGEDLVHRSGDAWHWMGATYPAAGVSLRSAAAEAFTIREAESGETVGMIDAASAPLLVHEEAVYMHGGRSFVIESYDAAERVVLARPRKVDYFTEPLLKVAVEAGEAEHAEQRGEIAIGYGPVEIVTEVAGYRRLRLFTHESLGEEELELPETRLGTTSCWLHLADPGLGAGEGGVLHGTGYLLSRVAPLYVLCDARDIRSYHQAGGARGGSGATLHLCDFYPGGAGFSARIFSALPRIVAAAEEVARSCPCALGCPSCFGPSAATAEEAKAAASEFLSRLRKGLEPASTEV